MHHTHVLLCKNFLQGDEKGTAVPVDTVVDSAADETNDGETYM